MIKRYLPGDPEFENVKRQITPIERVHNISQRSTYLDADRSNSKMSKKMRGENINKGI